MFNSASSFKGDIPKWDVSSATITAYMFTFAASFDGDLSKWDVSRVTNMNHMFAFASSFTGEIAKWNVSSVTNMDDMFLFATSFKKKICGDGWVNSKASKNNMFTGSHGSISQTACTSAPVPVTKKAPRRTKPERELIARKPISTPSVTS